MKKFICLFLCLGFLFTLAGCGESAPKCEHEHTTTIYEIDGLSIRKRVTCDDCEKEIEKTTVNKLQYVYDKVLVDESGIKCTLKNIELDGWSTVTLNFEIEGTSDSKRTFNVDKTFIDGYDTTLWVYASELANNKKSNASEWLMDLKAEDFLANQDHEVEMNYSIINSDTYSTLSENTFTFNLNEFTSIEEIKQ
ncbi:MAG: hypothetical protein IJ115_05590 [Erysipelotrichaceae bacterium]|nr:hypothetical protein [Erysipelotrichaceae bacterium]